MCDFVLFNPQKDFETLEAHLWAIESRDPKPDMAALSHAGEIGWELILDAFYPEDDDPSNLSPGDDASADLGGGSLEKVEVHPSELGQRPSSAKTSPSDSREDRKASWC